MDPIWEDIRTLYSFLKLIIITLLFNEIMGGQIKVPRIGVTLAAYGFCNDAANIFGHDLEKLSLDFYEVFNSGEILITDYSSIFYDFLLLNKPIFFTPVDIEKYEEDRGFLAESFNNYVPGPIILSQEKLMKEIIAYNVNKIDNYKNQRDWMLKFQHRYIDSNSSKRIYDFINQQVFTK